MGGLVPGWRLDDDPAMAAPVPAQRIRRAGGGAVRPDGDYVLYWMTANRRLGWNFALDRAVELCRQLGKPLLVFEPLRAGYRWASDRLHRFVIDGMADNAALCARRGVAYLPYVEPFPDADKGLLAALAARACAVVGDEYPCFFLPHLIAAGARCIGVAFEVVDANGIMPLQAVDRWFSAAVHFRRFLQAKLPLFLRQLPAADGLKGLAGLPLATVPAAVRQRWPAASTELLEGSAGALGRLLIDHRVAPVATRGGTTAARARLRDFLAEDLAEYGGGRNQPSHDRASRLSPWLHFGHLGAHEAMMAVLKRAEWSPDRLSTKVTAAKEGWWGVDASSESFLDELITWRELGFAFCHHRADHERWESLPDWARATLEKHAGDPRPRRYALDQFAAARTHDALWNAAQTQLLREGRIHNYLRMLWGKKILEWSASPREALATLIELNNRYALDGRDPNSYSGIFWTLGRFDRPWAPERPIFGVIRYMSSENTARKLKVGDYVDRYTAPR
jgi:deoxyribodipyrimidine photo-lyase